MPPGLDAAVGRFLDVDHWRRLNPQLTVSASPIGASFPIAPERLAQIQGDILGEGYFRLDDILPIELITAQRAAVDRLRAAKYPPVFLFLYDEPWQIGARLAPLVGGLLGGPYGQVPGMWVWHLNAQREAAGWPPHRDLGPDALYADGAPKIVTLWIPLADATPENGCIYMVPRHLDDTPGFVPANLQNIRALPVRAGSLLGWAHDVLHWSGRSSRRSAHDRISFAIEFQRTDVPGPLLQGPPYTEPLLDAHALPPFARRLSVVGQQVLLYSTRYQMPANLVRLARRLVEADDSGDADRILFDIDTWLASPQGPPPPQGQPVRAAAVAASSLSRPPHM